AAGVPILSALALTRAATGSAVVQRLLAAAEREVEAGRTLASVVGGRARLPAVVPAMIEVGETTGKLPEMLIRLADIYDEEVDQAVTTLTSLLEPALIVTMAILVGTIVVALFLPMVELIRGLSGG
ncbi:MAG TPA: type II secretion system F family protein, partial [Opitutaceae bacterium]|nr:type II secretion system F family protein [Opitutaceae bacterium]